MDTFMGMQIIASPILPDTAPNFRLAHGDYIGDEFRARMDAWCDEFFGRSPFFLIMDGNKILASSHNVANLRAAVAEHYPLLHQDTPK